MVYLRYFIKYDLFIWSYILLSCSIVIKKQGIIQKNVVNKRVYENSFY